MRVATLMTIMYPNVTFAFLQVSWVEPKSLDFICEFTDVQPTTWNTRSKDTKQGDYGIVCFKICGVSIREVCLSLSEPSWLECQRQLFLLNNSMASRHLKTRMINFSEKFWVATISKTSTFAAPKFSQSFSPLPFRRVLPAGLGPWGRNFPRLDTAALRSHERPRCGPRGAHRGQGGGGCGGQRPRPWPRTKDLKVQVFSRLHYFVLFFVIQTILSDTSSWTLFGNRASCPSQSKLFWVSGASILMWLIISTWFDQVSRLRADIFSRVGVCLSLSKPSWVECQKQLFFNFSRISGGLTLV